MRCARLMRRASENFAEAARPASPLFSGWNCTAKIFCCFEDGDEIRAVVAGGDSFAIRASRARRVRMREIEVRAGRDAFAAVAMLELACTLIPAHVRQLYVRGQERERGRAADASPAVRGASSLDSYSACRPRQIPRKGTPRAMASSSGARRVALVERANQRGDSGRRREE